MSGNKSPGFFSRNLVAIVMVPSLILLHWGWRQMQDIDILVKKEEKKELPIVLAYQYLEKQLKEKLPSSFKKDAFGKSSEE